MKKYRDGYSVANIVKYLGWMGVFTAPAIFLIWLIISSNQRGSGAFDTVIILAICLAVAFNSLLLVGFGYVMVAIFDNAKNTDRLAGLANLERHSRTPA